MMNLKLISQICIIFFIYIITSYFFIGTTSSPMEGDSLGYHIPIAKAYLDGSIFTPSEINGSPFLKFSPGASEGILAVLYLLHIPPNLYNVLGICFFFLSLFYLGSKFSLSKPTSLIFAASVSTLNGIVRWGDTQIIDIYLASFFTLSLALLSKPEKRVSYFLKLGIVMGMLVGSKYSGLLFCAVLLSVFGIKLFKYLSIKTFLAFLIPFIIFGFSWYFRNYISTGNPLYPQGFLIFRDHGFNILNLQVWRVVMGSTYGLYGTINAFISEYMMWVVSIPISLFVLFKKKLNNKKIYATSIFPLLIIGILNFIIYSQLPSDNKDFIMVSVIRYSWPAIIPFILSFVIIVKQHKWEEYLGVAVIANMFLVSFPQKYNPKILFFLIPIGIIYYYFTISNKGRR